MGWANQGAGAQVRGHTWELPPRGVCAQFRVPNIDSFKLPFYFKFAPDFISSFFFVTKNLLPI